MRAPFGQYGPVAAFELYLYTAVDSRPGPGGSRTTLSVLRPLGHGRHRFATASAPNKNPKKKKTNKNANLTSTQTPANATKPTPKKSFNKIWSANQLHSTHLTIKIKSHSLKNKNSASNQNQQQTQNRTTSKETTSKCSLIQSAPTQSNPIQSNPIQLHIQPNFDSVNIKTLFYPAISRLVQTKPARASRRCSEAVSGLRTAVYR